MQKPTNNAVTQGKHGQYNAVDYAANPDINVYAPEDGTISDINPNNGNCGRSFNLQGATGRHGFCHTEEYYVSNGQRVVRGQKLAKMGYTGLTIPKGPGGRHLHWILNRNGIWVYPPDYVNEAFIKQGEPPMNNGDVVNIYRTLLGRDPDPSGLAAYTGKDWKTGFYSITGSKEFGERMANLSNTNQAVAALRAALEAEKAKPAKEVIKEVEKIVEVIKEVQVIKEVPAPTDPNDIVLNKDSFWDWLKKLLPGKK